MTLCLEKLQEQKAPHLLIESWERAIRIFNGKSMHVLVYVF